MDNKLLSSEESKKDNYNSCSIHLSDINEEDYVRQSKSLQSVTEYEFLKKKEFESKVNIIFPSERIFRKNEFDILGLLGRGAYAKVVKAKHIQDNIIYAIKIIDKTFIVKVI